MPSLSLLFLHFPSREHVHTLELCDNGDGDVVDEEEDGRGRRHSMCNQLAHVQNIFRVVWITCVFFSLLFRMEEQGE